MKKIIKNFVFIFIIWIFKFMFKLFMSGDNDLINTSLIQSKDDIIGLNDMKNIMIFHINKLNLNFKHEKQIFLKIYRKIRTNSILT